MTPNETLTRRRDPHRCDSWLIYFDDVHVGSVARAVGTPGAAERWVWICGFCPGSEPGEQTHGTAATFDQARADFERAWMLFSSRRTEADYEEWRDQRDWTARKYAMGDVGTNSRRSVRIRLCAVAAVTSLIAIVSKTP